MTWRLENSRSFMLDKALHPAQVWIQGPVHPLGQRRSEQAQEPWGTQLGVKEHLAATGDVVDLPLSLSVKGS